MSEPNDRPITNSKDRTVIWVLKTVAKQIRELANAEDITVSAVAERDLIPAIAKRHRKLREKQAAELQASDLGGEG